MCCLFSEFGLTNSSQVIPISEREKYAIFQIAQTIFAYFHHAWDVSDYATMHFYVLLRMSKTLM